MYVVIKLFMLFIIYMLLVLVNEIFLVFIDVVIIGSLYVVVWSILFCMFFVNLNGVINVWVWWK